MNPGRLHLFGSIMRQRASSFILISLTLSFGMIIGACRRATTPEAPTMTSMPISTQGIGVGTPEKTLSQPADEATEAISSPTAEQPYPLQTNIIIPGTGLPYPPPLPTRTQPVTQFPQVSQTQPTQTPTPSATTFIPPYPGASPMPTLAPTIPYPGPLFTSTSPYYPGPATSTPRATRTPSRSVTASVTDSGSQTPTIVSTPGTGTPVVTPTELPPRPPLSPPPAGSSVTIWHSWGSAETDTLQSIIQSFTRSYPDVTFSLLYIPQDDLFETYREAAYLGQGPSLLLGPSNWGPSLYDETLISDLAPYVPEMSLAKINPAALSSGKYHNALISLPLSQHGLVMFRNTALISTYPTSFDELISLSHQTTRKGVVGSYLERGSYFSSPGIIAFGGRLMDENGNPAFNDLHGIEWLDLLEDYDEAGAVTFNTNRDLEMFKRGRVGIIIDGTWNISTLAESIGAENLAIDPWPTYGTGHISGWVETDNIFMNANSTGDNQYAALTFVSYLLDPHVQMHLAEVGHIPSVITTLPRDVIIQQAMEAFSDGVPYPNVIDEYLLGVYWNELDLVIRNVFEGGADPARALEIANNNIKQVIREIQTAP